MITLHSSMYPTTAGNVILSLTLIVSMSFHSPSYPSILPSYFSLPAPFTNLTPDMVSVICFTSPSFSGFFNSSLTDVFTWCPSLTTFESSLSTVSSVCIVVSVVFVLSCQDFSNCPIFLSFSSAMFLMSVWRPCCLLSMGSRLFSALYGLVQVASLSPHRSFASFHWFV